MKTYFYYFYMNDTNISCCVVWYYLIFFHALSLSSHTHFKHLRKQPERVKVNKIYKQIQFTNTKNSFTILSRILCIIRNKLLATHSS